MNAEDLVARYNIPELTTNTVLVVDDEKENLQIMELVLGKHFKVLSAISGQEALDILDKNPCDVIVVDQRMPGMTGVELLEKVCGLDRDITGIVVTAYAEYKAIMAAINRGRAFKFILKPFDGTQLIATIHEAMEKTFDTRMIRALVKELNAHVDTLEQKNSELQAMHDKLIMSERFSTVGRMTSGIVHDMGNALSGLLFMGNELRSSDCAKDIRDIFDLSVSGLEKLHNTLRDIRSFVHSGSVVGIIHKDPADIEGLIQDAVKLARMNESAGKCQIDVDVQPDMPEILVDKDRISQSIVNIINNAVDATGDDGHIVVSASSRDNWVKIQIQDNGPGMSEDVMEHIFEPMFSTKDKGGLGMGLYMVESIIKAHGGTIGVHSAPGAGATFRILLPVK